MLFIFQVMPFEMTYYQFFASPALGAAAETPEPAFSAGEELQRMTRPRSELSIGV